MSFNETYGTAHEVILGCGGNNVSGVTFADAGKFKSGRTKYRALYFTETYPISKGDNYICQHEAMKVRDRETGVATYYVRRECIDRKFRWREKRLMQNTYFNVREAAGAGVDIIMYGDE